MQAVGGGGGDAFRAIHQDQGSGDGAESKLREKIPPDEHCDLRVYMWNTLKSCILRRAGFSLFSLSL